MKLNSSKNMKIYQRLEQLLKFRIYSNAEIPEYLKKLSNMGKLDEVRKQALIILILTVLGEIEDQEDERKIIEMKQPILPKSGELHFMPDLPERREGALTPLGESLKCPDCPMVAKTKLGLISHSRKHKKVI